MNENKLLDYLIKICYNINMDNYKTKRKTNEQFLEKLNNIMPNIEPLEEYKNNHTKIKCKCTIHNEICESTPKRLLLGYHCCKKCSNENKSLKRLKSNEWFLQKLNDNNIDVIPLEEYKGNSVKILFKCSCGDLWETTPERVLLGNHCKKCGYKNMQGENNYFYNPNLTEIDRQDRNYRFRNPEYKKFIQECFKRDKYTCQISGKKSSGDIVVHHINGYNWDIKNRTNVDNGITLNKDIHKKFHKLYGKGNNTKEQFKEFIDVLLSNNDMSIENYKNILKRLNNIK